MSPRAACRLELLGFEAHDYVAGKNDWLAHGLPSEGEHARVPQARDALRDDVITCRLGDRIGEVRERVRSSPYGFGLVLADQRVVLGRLRMSSMRQAADDATAEEAMQPGPSTIRAAVELSDLVERLTEADLETVVVTSPEGRLLGIVRRDDAARPTRRGASPAG